MIHLIAKTSQTPKDPTILVNMIHQHHGFGHLKVEYWHHILLLVKASKMSAEKSRKNRK